MAAIDMLGQTFGTWTVIGRAPLYKRRAGGSMPARWLCRCACGIEKVQEGGSLRRHKSKACRSCSKHIRPFESLFNFFVGQSVIRKIECSITYEQFVAFTQENECHYCGEPITWTKHGLVKNGAAYHLDRKDNADGYHAANVVVCCTKCNRTKLHALSYEEMCVVGNMRRRKH